MSEKMDPFAPMKRTDRENAEMVARFRTPPGFSWVDLANDIETLLKDARKSSLEATVRYVKCNVARQGQ
jgi:hypothetical protein